MKRQEKKKLMMTGIVAAVVLVLGFAALWIVISNRYESTDDAQIDGNIAPVKTSVNGYVKEIRFKDDQFVKKGDTLVVLDNTDLLTKVKIADTDLQKAKVGLGASKLKSLAGLSNITIYENNVKSGRQSVLSAKADLENIQKSYNRAMKLFAVKSTTQEQADEVFTQLQIAKANYQKVLDEQNALISSVNFQKANFKSDDAQNLVAESLIKQKEAELEMAKENLAKANIIAPFSGITTKRTVNEGEYLSAGQSICALIDNQNIWVTANFKETQLKNMHVGQKVRVSVSALCDIKLIGSIESFAGATGSKFSLIPPDNASGNFTKVVQRVPVRIKLQNVNDDLKKRLYPGLSSNVSVYLK